MTRLLLIILLLALAAVACGIQTPTVPDAVTLPPPYYPVARYVVPMPELRQPNTEGQKEQP